MSRKHTTALLSLGLITGALHAPLPAFAQIPPAGRGTTWSPGIPGGIPVYSTVCATVNASTYGNGTADASGGIQAAINACPVGRVVQLSAGDFRILNTIEITKGIVLRGMGPTQTRLKMPIGTDANVVTIGQQWFPSYVQTVNLAADAVKGTQSVVLASNPGLLVGEIVNVDQLHDPNISAWAFNTGTGHGSHSWFTRPERPLGQVMEVASVSGNTVTFTTPFHITFSTARTAQLSRMAKDGARTDVVKYAGLEDLLVYGGSNGQGNVWLHAAYSWVKNIEATMNDGGSISLDGAFRCVVRDSYIHTTQVPRPGGGGYALAFAFYSADNLIENNIVWNMNKVMVMRATGGGNVIGYNYMDDSWIDYATTWVEVGLNASHGATPHFELFEGNQSFNLDGDNVWGNAVYITAFRNHLTGRRRSAAPLGLLDEGNRRSIGLHSGHWWYSFIGNVLGSSGQSPYPHGSFTYEDTFPWGDNPVPMWRLGYGSEDSWDTPADPKVVSTTVREGNYDYATNTVRWDTAPQALPNSLYLPAKPAFFGASTWPWVDPLGSPKVHNLPARVRFEQMKVVPPSRFYPVNPCRVADTRNSAGFSGGPVLAANQPRDFQVAGICGVPVDARAVATNVTVVSPAGAGNLNAYPPGSAPLSSMVNFRAGQTRANNAIVGVGTGNAPGQSITVFSTAQTHVILDVVGYFK